MFEDCVNHSRVYVTGDCHGSWRRFSTNMFKEQKEMTRDDIVIVCGDFGIWHDTSEEQYWLDWLQDKCFTIAFVDGNHENFDRLYSDEFETVDFHGGKAHKIRENVYHLMRGYVFEFGGKKFFAFGGASSHDIDDGILREEDYPSVRAMLQDYKMRFKCGQLIRVDHISWWERELPSQEEMDFGREQLRKAGDEVDFIITHCAPARVASSIGAGFRETDCLNKYFNDISLEVGFKRWYFGHYHIDDVVMGCEFICLYRNIERIV